MNSLETQVGQIYINDRKLSRSFVSLLSEKVPETQAEIFSVMEVPILNPAAWPEYDRIAKLIQTVLRKNFRRDNANSFENAIAQINDELAKAAAAGQTSWIGKMNGCLAVRQGRNLYISTTGKIHAYLFRDGQLADIADSPAKTNPLKTFENFAVGKITRKDFLIFTTTQLFNYISVERVKDIISHAPLAAACQNIAEVIKNLSDDSISFGTFILELGTPKEFPVETILKFSPKIENRFLGGLQIKFLASSLGFSRMLFDKLGSFKPSGFSLKDANPLLLRERARKLADFEKIKNLPRAKKFFLLSASVFALILIVNLFVAVHVSSARKAQRKFDQTLVSVQSKINDANSAYIYSDKGKSLDLLNQAQAQITAIKLSPKDPNNTRKAKVSAEITELQNSIGGLRTADTSELTSYSGKVDAIRLTSRGIYFIDKNGGNLALFDPKTKAMANSFLINPVPANINTSDDSLYYADFDGKIFKVTPDSHNTAAQGGRISSSKSLIFYGSPPKAYALGPNNNILVSKTDSDNSETNYLKQSADLSNAIDMAIDGSVYVLFSDHIKKFTAGQEKQFANPNIQYSQGSKIYANNLWKYIYLIDPTTKKIVILDKSGNVKSQYTSTKFDALRDLTVDESAKTAYVLNGNSLLEFKLAQ